MNRLFYLIDSVDQITFRPNLEPDEQAQQDEIIKRYQSVIAPPAARADGQHYVVTAYAIREQALERHLLTVSRDGDITDEQSVLERDMPLVYGL